MDTQIELDMLNLFHLDESFDFQTLPSTEKTYWRFPPLLSTVAVRSRGSTGRSKGLPMGNPNSQSAQMGNILTARTMILMLVASALGVWVVLEQPSTSLMEFHVLFQRFLRLVPMRVLSMQMADFGSPTSKPTLLYSSNLAYAFARILFF